MHTSFQLEVICSLAWKEAILSDLYSLYPSADIKHRMIGELSCLVSIIPYPDFAAIHVFDEMARFYGSDLVSLNWYTLPVEGYVGI